MTDDSKPAAPSEREWTIRAYREEPCNALHAIPENHTDDLRWGDEVWVVEKARLTAAEAERDEWKRRHKHLAAGCDENMRALAEQRQRADAAEAKCEVYDKRWRELRNIEEHHLECHKKWAIERDTWQRMAEELGESLRDMYDCERMEWGKDEHEIIANDTSALGKAKGALARLEALTKQTNNQSGKGG